MHQLFYQNIRRSFSGHLILNPTHPCVALFNRYGYRIWHIFLHIIKRQKSEGMHEIFKNWKLLEENNISNVNFKYKKNKSFEIC